MPRRRCTTDSVPVSSVSRSTPPFRLPPLVLKLREAIEEEPTRRITEQNLTDRGIDPSTARRQFRRYYGMTFHA